MLLAGTSACTTLSETVGMSDETVGTADLRLANGASAGTATLMRDGDDFTMAVRAMGLQPGAKGFHLHTTGRCDAPDFTSAGGHLNPGDRSHGRLDPQGPHLGDMTNLQVGADGMVTATVEVPDVRDDTLTQIFDADGTAVMIHSGPDDYRTDPSGDAGSRVACGVLVRS
ncbi:MAG: superoxide dismutase family protein [Erythrobacter sp.]|nr:superoxide dismutase family protein [Erythrobacter sp.]